MIFFMFESMKQTTSIMEMIHFPVLLQGGGRVALFRCKLRKLRTKNEASALAPMLLRAQTAATFQCQVGEM